MHGVATAAKTLQASIRLLDDMADLCAAALGAETEKTLFGKTAVQLPIAVIACKQAFLR
ncbi:hypothetical protein D3C80_1808000 [compost metagenome]